MKKLYRSRTNKIFFGLLGGIGEYVSVDPVIVRIIALVLIAATHVVPGILIYILGVVIVPLPPAHAESVRDAETVHEEK